MPKKMLTTGLLILACTGILFSQINLHHFRSRSVRQGYRIGTHIDSLFLNTKVSAGSAKTRMTIVAQPLGVIRNKITLEPTPVDSVEMTLDFSLPTDFVADSMWLWVEGKPVEAYIQDRALASGQYNQIVGTRRDPALLQYSGNGRYSLRIFPAESYKSRKIAIQFHHTFDDDTSAGMRTVIPVAFDSTYSYYKTPYDNVKKQIDCINALFSTSDQYTYKVDLPGAGSGAFSNAQSLSLSCRNVAILEQGYIIGNDPSGTNDFLWLSKDKITGKTIAGVKVIAADSNVTFEDEPRTRIIALDIRNKTWNWHDYYKAYAEHLGQNYTTKVKYPDHNVHERAQKYAVLCLKHYLDGAKEFNIVIGGKTVQTLFDKPYPANPANIKQAIDAIRQMTPDGYSSTSHVITAACSQANQGIVILISDLFEPYNYYEKGIPRVYKPSTVGIEYNNMLDYIDKHVDSTGIVLFTIDDNARLYRISYKSGGYRLGNLLNKYSIEYRYEIVNGRRLIIPIMPPLFGSRNTSGIRKLSVTSNELTGIVYTKDGYTYNNLKSREPIMTDANIKSVPNPYPYYSPASTLLRIAGVSRTPQLKEASITIKGRLGGLKFSKNILATTSLNTINSSGEVQWAFRKSESLAQENYTDNAKAIKAIGKEYHIITRQTSLLALEPGMSLWEDTLSAPNERELETSAPADGAVVEGKLKGNDGAPATTPQTPTGNSIDFDGFSLEDLIKHGITEVSGNSFINQPVGMSVQVKSGIVHLVVPPMKNNVILNLFDLKGSLVLQKVLGVSEIQGSVYDWNINKESRRLSRGFYMLQISTNVQKKVLRIPLIGK